MRLFPSGILSLLVFERLCICPSTSWRYRNCIIIIIIIIIIITYCTYVLRTFIGTGTPIFHSW